MRALILLAASLDPAMEEVHPLQRVGAWAPVRALLPRMIRNANAELLDLKPQLEALRAELPLIRCPVLIVHGTRDDLVPFSNAAYAAANLTGACHVETIVLEGADHFLPWNATAAVRDAIARAERHAMLTMPADWLAGLSSVVAFSTEPWLLLPSLVLITFLLEDVAIAAGVALALNGTIGWEAAFAAVAGGIALGDIGLYGMGRLAIRVPALGRRLDDAPVQRARFGARKASDRRRAGRPRRSGPAVRDIHGGRAAGGVLPKIHRSGLRRRHRLDGGSLLACRRFGANAGRCA